MKKNSFMVKNMFMSMLTAGIFATAFTACHDDDFDPQGFNNGLKGESFELTNLEQYSYTVPVQVNIEGDWEIELKFNNEYNHFCYALPSNGHGPQTIKLCMLDNWTESRNEGQMIIHDLSNNKNDQSFRLMQKCNLDNAKFMAFRTRTRGGEAAEGETKEEAEKKEEEQKSSMYNQGLRTKAVGYGYNVTKVPGPGAVSTNPIIALELLEKEGNDAGARTGGCQGSNSVHTYQASSYEELFQTITLEAEGKVTKGGLTAEMKGSYTHNQKSRNDLMYVYTTVDANMTSAYLSGIDRNNIQKFLTDNAKNAINGAGVYATGDKGFRNLLRDYGSHLIMKSNLGGRLRYASTVEKSLTTKKDSASAYAKCSYKNKIVDNASASVNGNISKNYENHTSSVKTNVQAFGGAPEIAAAVNMTDESVDAWLKSLGTLENLMCVGIGEDKDDLIPLYDLVDTSLPGGAERKEAMEQFYKTGMAEVMAYDGTEDAISEDVFHFTIKGNDFEHANGHAFNHKGTLVYEAWWNNKVVAMICKEYMPQISNMGLVLTVYPVKDNKVDFMNGRFLGNNILPAQRIVWSNSAKGKAALTRDGDKKAMETEIYVRGGQIFTFKPFSNADIREAEIKGKYLKGDKAQQSVTMSFGGVYKAEGKMGVGIWCWEDAWLTKLRYEGHEYPLVKIGNHIWTRENFGGNIPHGKDEEHRNGTHIESGKVYYTNTAVENASFPTGWHAGKSSEYQDLKATILSDNMITETGNRMQLKGASGFNMEWDGWYTYDLDDSFNTYMYKNYSRKGGCSQVEFITPDKHHIRIRDDRFDIVKETYTFAMPIRLVMDM
jgi:uncharacterized protein (TIGR02145 family)